MTCTCGVHRLDGISSCYEDLHDMLTSIAYAFKAKYGGDPEELLSEANSLFVLAYNRFNPDLGYELSTYVYAAVWRGLCCSRWQQRKRMRGCRVLSLDELADNAGGEDSHGMALIAKDMHDTTDNIHALLTQVGEDCKNIVQLILYPPPELSAELAGYNDPEIQRGCLEEYLRFRLKWARSRIERSIREMRAALQS